MARRLLHLLNGAVLLTALAGWLVFTIWLVVRAVDGGILEPRKGVVGVGFLIFITPVAIGVALDEFVIQRLRNGPPARGRHQRFVLPDISDPDHGGNHEDRPSSSAS